MKGFIEVTERYTYTTSHRDEYDIEDTTVHTENLTQTISVSIIKRVISENKISEYVEIFFDEMGKNRISVLGSYIEIIQKIKEATEPRLIVDGNGEIKEI